MEASVKLWWKKRKLSVPFNSSCPRQSDSPVPLSRVFLFNVSLMRPLGRNKLLLDNGHLHVRTLHTNKSFLDTVCCAVIRRLLSQILEDIPSN